MKSIIVAAAFAISSISFAQSTYLLDKYHTNIGFSSTHFGISHVDGKFKNTDATFKSAKADFTDAVVEMSADVKSIDTGVEMRDNDLKGDKWFDTEKFPTLIFKSTSFTKKDVKNYKLAGNITMHGITKPIVFDVVYNGKELNPMTKKSSVGFTLTGKLNRNDFGIGTGTPTAVVADEIELKANTEFVVSPLTSEGR